jgi:hypothetical protein
MPSKAKTFASFRIHRDFAVFVHIGARPENLKYLANFVSLAKMRIT